MSKKRDAAMALVLGLAIGNLAPNLVQHYKVIKVIDGDTIKIWHDKVPEHLRETNVRLAGIDTPEIRGKCDKEKELAQEAKKYIEDTLNSSHNVKFNVISRDKYGRYLVVVYADDININKALIEKGLAYEYYGGTKQSWCD
jgi:endonuclease YncB( thermonuclease family)